MADVYLAHDQKLNRKVALKVLKSELAATIGSERFLREIDIIARLAHPHILPLLDSGDADGSLFYAMPYVQGESLRSRIAKEVTLPIDEAVRIAGDVAGALQYAHGLGVVHRDIKPDNILMLEGHAVVADFGIARALNHSVDQSLTATGVGIGTPAYMSPEQASAEREVDGRADIYSLGCVLYEMLGGEPPFSGRNAQAVIAKRMSQPAPSVCVIRAAVPKKLDRIVRRAMNRSPVDRFQTAEAFRLELVAAATDSGGETGAAMRSRSSWVQSIAVLPFESLSPDPVQQYLVDGMHDAIVAQLAQIAALRVTSRTSVAHYRNSNKTLPQIARELKVDAVIEGSVLCNADRVRVHLELIRPAPTEHRIWGQTYDRDIRDILALHSEVARTVAGEIRATVTADERRRLAETRVVHPEAYRHCLIGDFQLGQSTEAAFRDALQHYEQALLIDSDYGPAYAGKAVAYIELGSWASSLPPPVQFVNRPRPLR
jgi:serine/threonine-protein kinase